MDFDKFLSAIVQQDAEELRTYFEPNATVRWLNSGETFTLEQYIRANCDYPGDWSGEVERVEHTAAGALIAVSRVWSGDGYEARSVSFIEFGSGGKITRMDEYWGDVEEPPAWRHSMQEPRI